MSAELLPCPFCGHVGLDFEEGSTFRWMLPSCAGCGATCGEVRIQTSGDGTRMQWLDAAKADAVKQWNTRATQPQAPQGAAPLTVADIVKTPGIAGLKAAPLLSKLKAAGFDVTLNQPLAPDHIAALIVMPTACGNDRPQGAVTEPAQPRLGSWSIPDCYVSQRKYDLSLMDNVDAASFLGGWAAGFSCLSGATRAAPETPEGKK